MNLFDFVWGLESIVDIIFKIYLITAIGKWLVWRTEK